MTSRFDCLYTKHKAKKKKTWTDGVLMMSLAGNIVSLYDNEDNLISLGNPLETRAISNAQKGLLLNKKGLDIEFEGFLVTVESSSTSNPVIQSNPSSSPNPIRPTKLAKFKVPSTVPISIPIIAQPSFQDDGLSLGKRSRGAYQVNDEELDDIWKNSVPTVKSEPMRPETQSISQDFPAQPPLPTSDFSAYDIWGLEGSPMKATPAAICRQSSSQSNHYDNTSKHILDINTTQQPPTLYSRLDNPVSTPLAAASTVDQIHYPKSSQPTYVHQARQSYSVISSSRSNDHNDDSMDIKLRQSIPHTSATLPIIHENMNTSNQSRSQANDDMAAIWGF